MDGVSEVVCVSEGNGDFAAMTAELDRVTVLIGEGSCEKLGIGSFGTEGSDHRSGANESRLSPSWYSSLNRASSSSCDGIAPVVKQDCIVDIYNSFLVFINNISGLQSLYHKIYKIIIKEIIIK